mmetsp:Transcript_29482/g.34708  ORF Transcript_29482/g.34708 Transcript_29482/m.34708 type:complete len:241 (-) Transcript_29482:1509-2231(-)
MGEIVLMGDTLSKRVIGASPLDCFFSEVSNLFSTSGSGSGSSVFVITGSTSGSGSVTFIGDSTSDSGSMTFFTGSTSISWIVNTSFLPSGDETFTSTSNLNCVVPSSSTNPLTPKSSSSSSKPTSPNTLSSLSWSFGSSLGTSSSLWTTNSDPILSTSPKCALDSVRAKRFKVRCVLENPLPGSLFGSSHTIALIKNRSPRPSSKSSSVRSISDAHRSRFSARICFAAAFGVEFVVSHTR